MAQATYGPGNMTQMISVAGPMQADLLAGVHSAAFPPGECWSAAVIALQLGAPGGFGFVHQWGGMVLGRVVSDEAEILTLAVVPSVRRTGIGMALLRAAISFAGQQEAIAMFLEVAVTNSSARGLYGHAGFIEVGRRPRYYADGADALVLRRDLSRLTPG